MTIKILQPETAGIFIRETQLPTDLVREIERQVVEQVAIDIPPGVSVHAIRCELSVRLFLIENPPVAKEGVAP